MKTYKEIIEDIKNEECQELMAVVTERMRLRPDGDIDESYACEPEITYAGSTALECMQKINGMADNMEAEFGERYVLYAVQVAVSLDMVEDIADVDEETMNELVARGFNDGDYDNVGTDDWNHRTVDYPYEPLKGSIIAYYNSKTNNLKELELIDDARNTMICIDDDNPSGTRVEVLLSAAEINKIESKEELVQKLKNELTILCETDDDYISAFVESLHM